ncbi:hypothetical protein B0H13DRAFT_2425626 [Mycena leptocephala]|nr:hypothetical protein B0H13DRAFT_2425626 [Mycena leptocephala]
MQRLKSKLGFGVSDTRDRKTHLGSACSALRRVLLSAKDVSASVGVPGLSIAVAGLILVLDVIQKTVRNAEDIEDLTKHLENLMWTLSQATERGAVSHAGVNRIDRLAQILIDVSDRAKAMGSRSIFKRTVTYNRDEEWLREKIQAMSWAIESFTVETTLHVEFMLDEHVQFIKDATHTTHSDVGATYKAIQEFSASLEMKEGYLTRATKAAFNTTEREACSDSTREEILSEVFNWIHRDFPGPTEPGGDEVNSDPPIFWINGSAGTGKTTIAYTVAKGCWDSIPNSLGASFFCSRDDAECSNLGLLFTTIAHQLCVFNPLFAAEVSKALKAKPDIGYASVSYQLAELIVKPQAAVRHSFRSCVIVLDALDECKHTATISTALSALSHYILDLFPLKFLVTSRPEPHITTGFMSPTLQCSTRRVVLHQLELPVVQKDIQTYLSSRLITTKSLYHMPEEWPTPESLHTLTQLSAGLCIFAATSVKFIEDPFYSNPRKQLVLLLRNTGRVVGRSSPFDRLDQLYTEILNLAYPDICYQQLRVLKTVLGSILHIRDSISPLGLENLLSLGPGRVRETLLRLHSVVIVPESDSQCIRLLHPSFFDFLTDPSRCPIPLLAVKFEEQNTLLALSCLRAMNGLAEVTDLAVRISAHIPAHVKYAIRHWAYHLSASILTDTLLDAFNQFCSQHLLHWIEVCSLLGELRQALDSVAHLRRNLVTRGQVDMALLNDCEHLIREFFPVISISALQVYHSALLFAPDSSLILRTFHSEMDLPVQTYNSPSVFPPMARKFCRDPKMDLLNYGMYQVVCISNPGRTAFFR